MRRRGRKGACSRLRQRNTSPVVKHAKVIRPTNAAGAPANPGVAPRDAVAGAVDLVQALYRREALLRVAARRARAATNAALVEAVRVHDVEYERLARCVIPPATKGDDIAAVRAKRKQVAATLRKRVEREQDKRHASSSSANESSLSGTPGEHTMVGKETPTMPTDSYLKRRIVEEYAPADTADEPDEDDLDDDHDLDGDQEPCGIGGDEELAGDAPEGE